MAKTTPKLSGYRDKRDPGKTTEPFSPEPMVSYGASRAGAFVVHLHAASRLHYDLRIEVGGSLMSFAIPRGPSLDPEDKRLAVNTENHPLEYLDFEDIIPAGNYGAGAMILWDRGLVRYLEGTAEEGIARGKIDFELRGTKLRGRFALVKTSGRGSTDRGRDQQHNHWLLLKKRDGFARSDAPLTETEPRSVLSGLLVDELARVDEIAATISGEVAASGAQRAELDAAALTPMLCASEGVGLHNKGFVYELKLDGVRILAARDGTDTSLRYRTRRTATASYPEISRAVASLPVKRFVLDGEIVAFDESGRPSFQRLGQRIHASRPHDVRRAARQVPVAYVVFDLLALDGYDLRKLPLLERKRHLRRLVPGRGLIRVLDHLQADGRPLFEFCRQQRLEGVVAKRSDSPYVSTRSGDWVKLKCQRDDEFIIVGFTHGQGARSRLGALEVASYRGDRLVVRGRVGSGLDDRSIDTLLARLAELQQPDSPASASMRRPGEVLTYVRPEVAVSVAYGGWTDEGRLRHAVFRGLRPDTDPARCRAAPPEELLLEAAKVAGGGPADRPRSARQDFLSNQDKVFWPEEQYTKGDLCNYYAEIGDTLLPHLRDRPVILVRYPDGIAGKHFYQWNVPAGTPSWIQTLPLRWEEAHGRKVTSFLINDADTLVYVANLGCIPLHVLASRVDTLDDCDFLTIDFDIGDAPFRHAVELARALKGLLAELSLEGYPKTSGQSGLHVLVPLGPGVPFGTAKMLAELIGRILQARRSDIASFERMRNRRAPGTVYVDTGQTGRSRSIVAPYSVRAVPGARVSTPLTWDEVSFALDPATLTISSVPERLRRYGDPLQQLLHACPDVTSVLACLGKLLKRE
ncbi:MAG: DNA ligase D [Proteobacteria bacterium]|nr:DNA ligase D [Pseudomonadota bacterium]